ncbi:MAG TPA: histidine kinase [Pseudomonadales bacterium]|nr:histidine kinase [Pseudomonadales bacterium]
MNSRFGHYHTAIILALLFGAMAFCPPAHAVILWSDLRSRVVHNASMVIMDGQVKRDDKANDALYFKFRVDPLSDPADEAYYALFELVQTNQLRLGVGNALEAWGYSAAYTAETGPMNKSPNDDSSINDSGEFNLHSANPEAAPMSATRPYELPSHSHPRTIVFKVQYIPGADALVTVWLDPHLTHGWTEENQPSDITTRFKANACFDQIQLRHGGTGGPQHDGGNGWNFSDMAIATSFNDFVVVSFWETWWFLSLAAAALLVWVGATVRVIEGRKYQRQIQRAEQERTLERERARIAQDLHDELGSSLTRLSLLSGLVKADKESPEQVEIHANKLSQAADQTVRALEEIVWAVRPGSDTLQSLMDYIAHFANELFDGNSAHCRLDLPGDLPALPLPPDMRHNIFLIVKEALTNALKHAKAREVRLQSKLSGQMLEILVADDGKGFDPGSLAEGWRNGMGNMRRRAAAMSAKLDVQSTPRQGTTVALSVDLGNGKQGLKGS